MLLRVPFVLIWSGFVVVTIRQLWKPTDGRYQALVYGFGVRQVGLMTWVGMSLGGAVAFGEPPDGSAFLERLLTVSFIALPIFMWIGYYIGWTVARVMGIERPRR